MAVYPNNVRTASGWGPYRHTGASPTLYTYKPVFGSWRCRYVADSTAAQFPKTSSVPTGYAPYGALQQPYTAGAMAARQNLSIVGTGGLLSGTTLAGNAALTITGTSGLALVIALSGAAALSLAGTANLALTIAISGAGTLSLTGTGSLSMIVPVSGAGTLGITGTANLRGLLDLSGSFTASDAVTPQTVAAAVWNANSAEFVTVGTMGELLNTAGSGGLSPTQSTQLAEIHRIHGLQPANPLIVDTTTRTAGDIAQTIATAGDETTVTRT